MRLPKKYKKCKAEHRVERQQNYITFHTLIMMMLKILVMMTMILAMMMTIIILIIIVSAKVQRRRHYNLSHTSSTAGLPSPILTP